MIRGASRPQNRKGEGELTMQPKETRPAARIQDTTGGRRSRRRGRRQHYHGKTGGEQGWGKPSRRAEQGCSGRRTRWRAAPSVGQRHAPRRGCGSENKIEPIQPSHEIRSRSKVKKITQEIRPTAENIQKTVYTIPKPGAEPPWRVRRTAPRGVKAPPRNQTPGRRRRSPAEKGGRE